MDALIYQYACGGLLFATGMWLAGRKGYVGLTGTPALRGIGLVAGFLVFAVLQGWLQYAPMQTATPAPDPTALMPGVKVTRLDQAIIAAYFLTILAIGTYFGRRQSTLGDFLHGGQRFGSGLVALSLVATLVGSYSFVKYSRVAFEYGLSSTQTYLNDWFWMPLLLFGWLPILYFSRLTSVPEYFEKRFGPRIRLAATILILVYLVGYIGVNLMTMGRAMQALLGWDVLTTAILAATVSAIYVARGGQTSVIMTDLFQGVMLLACGALILGLGIYHLGGWDTFWTHLPRGHRQAFPHFNADPNFSGVGIFWQDAMANSAMFLFVNQGILMRFMAARTLTSARRAALAMPLLLMPIAAIVVAGGGWVARAMVERGQLPADLQPGDAFFAALGIVSQPGIFGLILAALTAALMSTVDTLVTAVAAIVVNDVYRPFISPQASDRKLLRVARISAIAVTVCGIALVPVFDAFDSIYKAHGAFTAAVTPPLVVTLMLSLFWPRFTRAAAGATLIGGTAAILLSLAYPELISPLAHGVDAVPGASGLKQYKFMRALYGLVVCGTLGVVVSWFTRPEPLARCAGLVFGTADVALRSYLGRPGNETQLSRTSADLHRCGDAVTAEGVPSATVSVALGEALDLQIGDLVLVSDPRWWANGFRSTQARVTAITEPRSPQIGLSESGWHRVQRRNSTTVRVERPY
jgi:SSS family solute:Na+ symporter